MRIYRRNSIILGIDFTPDSAVHRKELMVENVVTLKFELDRHVKFEKGDRVTYTGTDFILNKDYKPTKNADTGGYVYELVFFDQIERWKDFKLKYLYQGLEELEFNLTTSGDKHIDIVIDSLARHNLGTFVKGEFPTDIRAIHYQNTDIFSALNQIAQEYETEWWIDGNILHFGRCEFGNPVTLEYDVELDSVNLAPSSERLVTRLYAFGSERNLPPDYRAPSGSINHVTARRLRMPQGINFVDLFPNLPENQIIEGVQVFEDIFPRQRNRIVSVRERFIQGNGVDTQDTTIFTIRGDNTFTITQADIMPGEPLSISFQTGNLAGREFGLIIQANNEFEIVYNTDSNVPIPNPALRPQIGDEFFFFNIQAAILLPTAIQQAEVELHSAALDYLDNLGNAFVYDAATRSIHCENNNIDLEIGQRVVLKSDILGEIPSRIRRFEKSIYNRFECDYQIGDSNQYSRLGALEKSNDSILNMLNGNISGAIFDSVRNMFLSKTHSDTARGHIRFQRGMTSAEDATFEQDINVLGSTKTKDLIVSEVANLNQGFTTGQHFINAHGSAHLRHLTLEYGGQSPDFIPGMAGEGWRLQKKAGTQNHHVLEIDDLILRNRLYVNELIIKQWEHIGAGKVLSMAGVEIDRVANCNLLPNSNDRNFTGAGDSTVVNHGKVSVSEWNTHDANRVTAKGGTSVIKALVTLFSADIIGDRVMTSSCWFKNNGSSPITINSHLGGRTDTLQPGEDRRVVFEGIRVQDEVRSFQFQVRTQSVEQNADFTWWRMQVEEGSEVSDWKPDTVYRIYSTHPDQNNFIINDLALCQSWNPEATSNPTHRYWRLVANVAPDRSWLDLSKIVAEPGSDTPQVGDAVIQFGHLTDTARQNAIIISSYGADGPFVQSLRGINTFDLSGRTQVFIGNRTEFNVDSLTILSSDGSRMQVADAIELRATRAEVATAQSDAVNIASTHTDAQIGILANQIAMKVSQNEFDALGNRVSSAESALSLMPDRISMQVRNELQVGGVNLLPNSNDRNFSPFGGSIVTNHGKVAVPEWGATDANRVTTSGGTEIVKAIISLFTNTSERDLAWSCWVKNNGSEPIIIRANLNASTDSQTTLQAGEERRVVFATRATVNARIQFQAQSMSVGGNTDFTWWRMQVEEGNIASSWSESPLDTQQRIDQAQNTANAANTAVVGAQTSISSLRNFTDTTFRDGVIGRAERAAIESKLNGIAETKLSIDANFAQMNLNSHLIGTPRTNLANAHTALNTAHTNLVNSINTAIVGDTVTAAQKNEVDNRFGLFNTALATYQVRVEEANRSIQQRLDDMARERVDNIRVGGVNLLLNSETPQITSNHNVVRPITTVVMEANGVRFRRVSRVQGEDNAMILNASLPFSQLSSATGRLVTASFMARASRDCEFSLRAQLRGVEPLLNLPGHNSRINITTEWQQFSTRFVVPNTEHTFLDFSPMTLVGNLSDEELLTFHLDVRGWQVEEGNIATAWSESPLDIDNRITTARTIAETTQTLAENLARTTVSRTEFDSNDQAIRQKMTQIEQTAESIGMWVEILDGTVADNNTRLLQTGIDIRNREITLQASRTRFIGDNGESGEVQILANGRLYAEHATFVDMQAVGGTFAGEIHANRGSIGGFVITPDSLDTENFNVVGLGAMSSMTRNRFMIKNRLAGSVTESILDIGGLIITTTPIGGAQNRTARYEHGGVSYRNRRGFLTRVLGEQAPYVMGAFEINAAGQIGNLMWQNLSFSSRRTSRGWYEVIHNIGHTNYIVIATIRMVERRMVTVWSKTGTAFSLAVGNRQGDTADAALEVLVVGIL